MRERVESARRLHARSRGDRGSASAGSAFCSGIHLSALNAVEASPLARNHPVGVEVHQVALALADIDIPVIAAF
jgi:enoyl-CoA hydratase/carnithine racemase